MKRFFMLMVFLISSLSVQSAINTYEFDDPTKEDRFKQFSQELRCLVCQNQSLAESNAELAGDLRRELYRMIQNDVSDEEIIGFMVSRYGDFVLYRPPLKVTTYLLWFGPLIFIFIGLLALILTIRKRRQITSTTLTSEQRQQLNRILNKKENK